MKARHLVTIVVLAVGLFLSESLRMKCQRLSKESLEVAETWRHQSEVSYHQALEAQRQAAEALALLNARSNGSLDLINAGLERIGSSNIWWLCVAQKDGETAVTVISNGVAEVWSVDSVQIFQSPRPRKLGGRL